MQRDVAVKSADLEKVGALLRQPAKDHVERALTTGALALRTQTVLYAQRRDSIAAHLGVTADVWPATRLIITAVDCYSAELTTFDATSGVSLIDAVAASCAVPGIYPATPIGGRFYRAQRLAFPTSTSSCLNHVVPLGECHLRLLVTEFVDHYHLERSHQGLTTELIVKCSVTANENGTVTRNKRLGGMLNFYHRAAA